VIRSTLPIPDFKSQIIIEKTGSVDTDITEAEIIVAGGRGLKKAEDFSLLLQLAECLGGMVGASRMVVEEGWIDREHQVGYSGHRVKPRIYIACGISESPQHLSGMKESGTIIAINNDPSAPIFGMVDYGLVGDLYEMIPRMVQLHRSMHQ